MRQHPHLYEINLRVFLHRLGDGINPARLSDVPDEFWNNLRKEGMDMVWLMGIWRTCPEIIDQCCFEENLVQSYGKALKDWTREDVGGSPYAICDYVVSPDICTEEELVRLRNYLHKIGLQLILDFIPNHFSAGSEVILTNPEYFLEVSEDTFKSDPYTFYKPKFFDNRYFAHGRDPFFPGWTDTIQLNYFNAGTREFMTGRLRNIARYCDGVRCDMAMLNLNNVFHNTWRGIINEKVYTKPDADFWADAIREVKNEFADFIFIAESYWDLEWDLQQLGFDFTYDKKLLDRLKDGTPVSIRDHLKADPDYQNKSVRFIENHDEDRAISSLGRDKSFGAAIVISTVPGMRMFFDGQYTGKKIKLPVQLIREPKENVHKAVKEFYERLLVIADDKIFHEGEFYNVKIAPAWQDNSTHDHILAYGWGMNGSHAVVVVNYYGAPAQCRLRLNMEGTQENIVLRDALNDKTYTRSAEEIHTQGLYVELPAYQAHIFFY